jgi:hypothetical protein
VKDFLIHKGGEEVKSIVGMRYKRAPDSDIKEEKNKS